MSFWIAGSFWLIFAVGIVLAYANGRLQNTLNGSLRWVPGAFSLLTFWPLAPMGVVLGWKFGWVAAPVAACWFFCNIRGIRSYDHWVGASYFVLRYRDPQAFVVLEAWLHVRRRMVKQLPRAGDMAGLVASIMEPDPVVEAAQLGKVANDDVLIEIASRRPENLDLLKAEGLSPAAIRVIFEGFACSGFPVTGALVVLTPRQLSAFLESKRELGDAKNAVLAGIAANNYLDLQPRFRGAVA